MGTRIPRALALVAAGVLLTVADAAAFPTPTPEMTETTVPTPGEVPTPADSATATAADPTSPTPLPTDTPGPGSTWTPDPGATWTPDPGPTWNPDPGATATPDPVPTACGHSVCETGTALDPECDFCGALVCLLDNYCCDPFGYWDEACIVLGLEVCGGCHCLNEGDSCDNPLPCWTGGMCQIDLCVGGTWDTNECGPVPVPTATGTPTWTPSWTPTPTPTATPTGYTQPTPTSTPEPCDIEGASNADLEDIFRDFLSQGDEGFVVPEHNMMVPYQAGLTEEQCPDAHAKRNRNFQLGWYKILRREIEGNDVGDGVKVRLFVPVALPGTGGLGGLYFIPLVVDVEVQKVRQKSGAVCDQWGISVVADIRFTRGGVEKFAGKSACGRLPFVALPKLVDVARAGDDISIGIKDDAEQLPVASEKMSHLFTDTVTFGKNADAEWTLRFMQDDQYRLIPANRTAGIYSYALGHSDCLSAIRPCDCNQYVGGVTRDGYLWPPLRENYVVDDAVDPEDKGTYGFVTWSSPLKTMAGHAVDTRLLALQRVGAMIALITQIGPPAGRIVKGIKAGPGGDAVVDTFELWENPTRHLDATGVVGLTFNVAGLPIAMSKADLLASDCKKFEDDFLTFDAAALKQYPGYGEADWGDFNGATMLGLTPQ